MRNQITEGSIPKQLLAFFFPIWAGTFFQFFYNTADAAIVGNFLGKEALSAVGGSSSTIINLLVGFFVGLSSGATVIVSHLYGARDHDGTSRAVHTATALALVGGAFMTVLGIAISPWALRAMGTPERVLGPSITYLRIYFCGMIFNIMYNLGSGVLRATGDSRRPLYFLIVGCVSNIVLDFLFVVVIPMGVAGAAFATILSQAISAVLVVLSLRQSDGCCRLHLSKIRFDFALLWRMMRIGLPAGLQSVMYSASNIVIQTTINGFGTNAMAAWTAYGKIDGIFWMTVNSFGIAITTFVGQNFGARRFDRVKKSVHVCFGFSALASVLLSAFVLVLGPQLYHLFSRDADVVSIGILMLRCMVPFYVLYIPIEILSGALRGAGDAIMPMLIPAFGICFLRILWIAFVTPLYPQIEVVCMSYPVTWGVTSVLCFLYYKWGGWLRRCSARLGHGSADAL
ncbi:MAG: MATE family efflux transporter [Ruthenibacterium sp.]